MNERTVLKRHFVVAKISLFLHDAVTRIRRLTGSYLRSAALSSNQNFKHICTQPQQSTRSRHTSGNNLNGCLPVCCAYGKCSLEINLQESRRKINWTAPITLHLLAVTHFTVECGEGGHLTLWNSLCDTCKTREYKPQHVDERTCIWMTFCRRERTQWSRACRKSKSSSVQSSSVLDLELTRASHNSRRSFVCTQCAVSSHLTRIVSMGSWGTDSRWVHIWQHNATLDTGQLFYLFIHFLFFFKYYFCDSGHYQELQLS